ncbi:hypothetical protein [Enterovibrio norvegicus]|uniref:hypothetical protein n=1 Tax=Enterovibrio norvegicus TaxID=188144 RepID=UPI00352C0DB0
MDVNYSKYSPKSLLEALSTIDRNGYPENYANLILEISSRRDEISLYEASLEEKKVKKWGAYFSAIGYFQLITGFFAMVGCLLYLYENSISGAVLSFGVAALNGISGFFVVKRNPKYYWLCYLNQGLQVVSFGVGGLYFNYFGLGGIFLTYDWVSPVYNWLQASFSIGGSVVSFSLNNEPNGYVQIDVLAIFYLLVIYKVMSKLEANKAINGTL